MILFIHTYGRLDNQITFQSFATRMKNRTFFVVQHREKKAWLTHGRRDCNTIFLPKHIQTLSPTRQYIMEWSVKEGFDKICMMDDDLKFYHRPKPNDWHLKVSEPSNVTDMFNDLSKYLDTHIHAGVSPREFNQTVKMDYVECTKMTRILAYRPKEVLDLGCRFDRMMLMQDTDMTLQLIKLGKPNLVLYKFAQTDIFHAPGGVSTYRNPEMVQEQISKLIKLHYPFVTLGKRRKNVEDDTLYPRPLKIAWKRALKVSKTNPLMERKS